MSKLPILNGLRSCLSLTLALSCMLPVYAESVSIYQKLSEYEQTLFGKSDSSFPIDKRLQNVEKQLFGKPSKKGTSTADRIKEIDGVMGGKTGSSNYLPMIAPEMDRSGFAPQPKQAPSSPEVADHHVNRDIDAPLPADNGDRVKGILRQAMENYSQGKTAEAESAFLKVLAIDFRNVDANYNLGAISESKGDLESAKRYYTAALRSDPSDLEIKDAVAAVQDKIKKNQLARTPKPSAPAQAPSHNLEGAPATAGDRAIAAEAAASYKKGNFDDAIEKLNYLARKNPYDANTQFALGQAWRGKGKDGEAIRHLRAAATLDSKNDLYVKALGDLQAQMDERQTASAPKQDVQPFVGLPGGDDDPSVGNGGRVSQNDLAAVQDYLRRNTGNVMIGSESSYGGFSFGRGGLGSFGGMPMMGMGGMGMPMMLGTAPGGTRLKRVVSSSLSGAAMGAMSSRNQPGGMSKGAMRGAMYGGLYGLLGGY